jgi:hypothetical protein
MGSRDRPSGGSSVHARSERVGCLSSQRRKEGKKRERESRKKIQGRECDKSVTDVCNQGTEETADDALVGCKVGRGETTMTVPCQCRAVQCNNALLSRLSHHLILSYPISSYPAIFLSSLIPSFPLLSLHSTPSISLLSHTLPRLFLPSISPFLSPLLNSNLTTPNNLITDKPLRPTPFSFNHNGQLRLE